jgi:serine/threonine protein kinase
LSLQGKLNDGRLVAVKQLSIGSHQGKSQFIAEIATISAVQHRNLVKLYGCCIEGSKRLLVYEYLENKSLDQVLFGMKYGNFLPYLCWLVCMNANKLYHFSCLYN